MEFNIRISHAKFACGLNNTQPIVLFMLKKEVNRASTISEIRINRDNAIEREYVTFSTVNTLKAKIAFNPMHIT